MCNMPEFKRGQIVAPLVTSRHWWSPLICVLFNLNLNESFSHVLGKLRKGNAKGHAQSSIVDAACRSCGLEVINTFRGCNQRTCWRWCHQSEEEGLQGLIVPLDSCSSWLVQGGQMKCGFGSCRCKNLGKGEIQGEHGKGLLIGQGDSGKLFGHSERESKACLRLCSVWVWNYWSWLRILSNGRSTLTISLIDPPCPPFKRQSLKTQGKTSPFSSLMQSKSSSLAGWYKNFADLLKTLNVVRLSWLTHLFNVT